MVKKPKNPNNLEKEPTMTKHSGGSAKNQKRKSNEIKYPEEESVRFIDKNSEATFYSEKQNQDMDKVNSWLKDNPDGIKIVE